MRRFPALLLLVCLAVPIGAVTSVRFAEEITLPAPVGWVVLDDGSSYPCQLVNQQHAAELLIFKSEISPNETINDPEELKPSVDGIVNDVILGLPNAKILTNTGYNETSRIRFVIEFTSDDSATSATLYHRLTGVIYRHPDGHQLLFTLWGKSRLQVSSLVADDMRIMQEGFTYTGPTEADVFARPPDRRIWGVAVLVGVILLLFYLLKRRVRSGRAGANRSRNWRCPCGHINRSEESTCSGCGTARSVERVT
ncbi:MAG: hypothetical protein KAU35_07095 [candidate division Zixibacteria bacterium]|nr:hypothetical protein [candidate division Zixibacteria bacterium]